MKTSGLPSARRRLYRAFLVMLPLVSLAALDLALTATGSVPDEDPLLLYARTFEAGFTPFVEAEDAWTIRPDWRSDGRLRARPGAREGQVFILPGFRDVRISRPKPKGLTRVFVVGGSAVHGLGLKRRDTLPARLQRNLAEALPGQLIEVHNLGCPGWASDRVRVLVDRLLAMEPDVLVVHSGHNELLRGTVDPLTSLGIWGRWRLEALRRSSLFSWLDHLLGVDQGADAGELVAAGTRWRAGEVSSQPASTSGAHERAVFRMGAPAAYRGNLEAVAAMAQAASVPVVFVLPAANLRIAPRSASHAPGFDQDEAFDKAMDLGRRGHQEGNLAASLAALDRAAALSPTHAMVHFGRGLVLLAEGRRADALLSLRFARDADGWTHRITSELESAFGAAMSASGAPSIDAREVLDPLAAQESSLFSDHCHLLPAGHELLAGALVPVVLPLIAKANSKDE